MSGKTKDLLLDAARAIKKAAESIEVKYGKPEDTPTKTN